MVPPSKQGSHARAEILLLSLMQMAKSSAALAKLKKAGIPFISVLTDPTTGGVSASFAMLGDIQIAEPGSEIDFAGARVIEQTIREKLPEGFQRAEYLYDHGMVDMVVHRTDLRNSMIRIIDLLCNKGPAGDVIPLDKQGKKDAAATVQAD